MVVGAGMKVNGGFFRQDWFFVKFFKPNLLIGMLQIWRFKTVPCTAMIVSCSGSHDNIWLENISPTLTSLFFFWVKIFSVSVILRVGSD